MNIDFNTKEYLDKLGQVKLSDNARTRIENNLKEYVSFHGVRVEGDNRFIKQVPQRTSLFTLFTKTKSMTAIIIAMALIVGGGTSYAAEGSVPGDFLYSIKTGVNENVKSALAVSSEAEANLQVRLAEERLKEAEELASQGELTAQASADISSRLKTHYNEAEARSAELVAEGDFESSATVRASLEGSFRAYANILTSLNTNVSGNNGQTLIADLSTYADATARAQAEATTTAEASVDIKVRAESIVKQSGEMVTDLKEEMAGVSAKISVEVRARAEARLNEAMKAQAEAEASLKAQSYRLAYTSAQTALRIASEVEVMVDSIMRLEAGTNLDLNTENVINGLLNVGVGSETNGESNVEAGSQTNVNSGTTTTDTDPLIDLEAGASNSTTINGEVIDMESDTSVQSGLRI